jgi:hypothetical protein
VETIFAITSHDTPFRSVSQESLEPLSVVDTLSKRVDTLSKRVDTLSKRVDTLSKRVVLTALLCA